MQSFYWYAWAIGKKKTKTKENVTVCETAFGTVFVSHSIHLIALNADSLAISIYDLHTVRNFAHTHDLIVFIYRLDEHILVYITQRCDDVDGTYNSCILASWVKFSTRMSLNKFAWYDEFMWSGRKKEYPWRNQVRKFKTKIITKGA